MKNLFKSMLPVVAASLFAWGCKKDENMVMFETGTNPVLSTSTAAPQLITGKEKEVAMTLSWTNPEYKFNTGISSQDVQYRLEFDTVGANFGNARKGIVVVARDLSRSFTVEQLNALFSGSDGMRLPFDRAYNFEVRAVSTIGNAALPLQSNVVRFRATPFSPPPVVVVPDAGTLWATGNAFASDWKNPLPTPFDVNQKFTRRSNTLYELVVDMPGGGNYKLIQEQGNWGTQYHMLDGGTWDAGRFRKRDADPAFIGPPTAGKYKITVNFQDGVYSVVKQ